MLKTILALTIAISTLSACSNTSTKPEATAEAEEAAVLLAVFGKPTKVDAKKVEQFPLGSEKNPVRVAGAKGQRDYLSRLVCDNNERVSAFTRSGNAGVGPYGSIIDLYSVICDTNKGVVTYSVYLDMYHYDYVETRPAEGFIALKDK